MNVLRFGKDHFERVTALKVIRRSAPPFVSLKKRFLKVRLDITKGCNLRCVMCPSVAARDFEIQEMVPELFRKVAREVFPRAEHLTIGCGAEPLLARNFGQYMDTIRKYHIPYTLIISNGSLLTEQKAISILDAHIDEVSISLEAASKERYEATRVGAKFERLIENLERLNHLKAARQTDKPALSFNTVLMGSNLSELVPLIKLGKTLGIKAFCMAHLIPFEGLDNEAESLYHHQELANQKMAEAYEYAKSLGIHVFGPPLFGDKEQPDRRPFADANRPTFCVQPWTFMYITAAGDVIPCGWLFGEALAGSFRQQSFRQIWFGEIYLRLREEIRTGNLRARCSKCPAAALGDPNRSESFEPVYL